MSIKQISMDNVNFHFPLVLLEDNGSFGSDFELDQVFFKGGGELEEPPEPRELWECVFAPVLAIILSKMGAQLKETTWLKRVE